jgi:hypothetical protein
MARMGAMLENKPIDRVPTTKTFMQSINFMFAPIFHKLQGSLGLSSSTYRIRRGLCRHPLG